MRLAPGGPEPVPWSAAWHRIENGLAMAVLVCMAVLPLAEMVLRQFAGWSISGARNNSGATAASTRRSRCSRIATPMAWIRPNLGSSVRGGPWASTGIELGGVTCLF